MFLYSISSLILAFQCAVQRTHHRGERRRDNDPGQIVTATVHMFSVYHEELKREVTIMSMMPTHRYEAPPSTEFPNLLEPQLLTFSSDRGMMVVGFEEIDGRRYYQGWWMQWVNEG